MLGAGDVIVRGQWKWALSPPVLEGHRFASQAISAGEPLLSWGLPFGLAVRDLAPGDYVCNDKILEVLAERDIDFPLPDQANFRDHIEVCEFEATSFKPGKQVPLGEIPATFKGFRRAGTRGIGTRNFIVVLATTSDAAAFVESVAACFTDIAESYGNIDGVVAVTHTEGGGSQPPNNLAFVLRTLAGRLDTPLAQIVVFGDYLNDLEMFEIAGKSIAVANALPEVQAAAHQVIGSHAEGAVLDYLESLGF